MFLKFQNVPCSVKFLNHYFLIFRFITTLRTCSFLLYFLFLNFLMCTSQRQAGKWKYMILMMLVKSFLVNTEPKSFCSRLTGEKPHHEKWQDNSVTTVKIEYNTPGMNQSSSFFVQNLTEYQANSGLIIKSIHISMHVAQKWTRKRSVNKLLRYNSMLSQITYQVLFHEVIQTGDSSTDFVLASLAAFSVTSDSISVLGGQYSPLELCSCKQTVQLV